MSARSDPVAAAVLAEVERLGLLLVHDRLLPSVTSFVAGEPVTGSWWSHPAGKTIFNAVQNIEDDTALVKLVDGKQTLVARRLWPALAAVGSARAEWQQQGLDPVATALLARVEAGPDPVVVTADERKAAETLERRLLVHTTDVHTPRGNHVKAYDSWARWATDRSVVPLADVAVAVAELEAAAAGLGATPPVRLPWSPPRQPRRRR